jgi:hypothetical protein
MSELEQLEAGWAGDGTVVPSEGILKDVRYLFMEALEWVDVPGAEVDPDTGTVTLSWSRPGRPAEFSLVLRGKGEVTGVLTELPPTNYRPWRLPLSDLGAISKRLQEPKVRDLIAGQ